MKQKLSRLVQEAVEKCNGDLIEMFNIMDESFQSIKSEDLIDWAKVLDKHTVYESKESLLEIAVCKECEEMGFAGFCDWLVAQGERIYNALREAPETREIHLLAEDLDIDFDDLVKASVYAYLKNQGADRWNEIMYEKQTESGLPSILFRSGLEIPESDTSSYAAVGKMYLLFYMCQVMSRQMVA